MIQMTPAAARPRFENLGDPYVTLQVHIQTRHFSPGGEVGPKALERALRQRSLPPGNSGPNAL